MEEGEKSIRNLNIHSIVSDIDGKCVIMKAESLPVPFNRSRSVLTIKSPVSPNQDTPLLKSPSLKSSITCAVDLQVHNMQQKSNSNRQAIETFIKFV